MAQTPLWTASQVPRKLLLHTTQTTNTAGVQEGEHRKQLRTFGKAEHCLMPTPIPSQLLSNRLAVQIQSRSRFMRKMLVVHQSHALAPAVI